MQKFIKAVVLALLLAVVASLALPLAAFAQDRGTVVRVGWFESPFNMTDDYGRRSGYSYEYQQKIAAYTGWTYEYVIGSWPELLQKLKDGQIDLLSDVSFTEERSEQMLFSSAEMGSEQYYLFVSPKNKEITPNDLGALNGKKIGVNKDSFQKDLLIEWLAANGIDAEIVELATTAAESGEMLTRGEIDGFVAVDSFYNAIGHVPIVKIGSSDFYFAVSKSYPELLSSLNTAMERILTESPNFNQILNDKYLNVSNINIYLTADERSWLEEHGTIRVGYQDNYLAFCAKDPETGELTGALKDYLKFASDCLKNAHIDFEAISYPTAAAAMEALKNGEVDCMFPANLTSYDGESQGYFMTNTIMCTDISAIILESEKEEFSQKDHVTVAVNAGNPNYNMFLVDNFPEWRSVIFKNTPECLKAISEGKADCLLMSNYRYNNISSLCKKYGLTSISTGVSIDYCFAVNRDSITLYSILNKISHLVPSASVNAALSYYFTEDAKTTFGEMVSQNLGYFVSGVAVVALLIIFLVINASRSSKKASENRHIITATETDELTGLYTKTYFYEYAGHMFAMQPTKPMDVVVAIIDQFYSLSAIHGREFSDRVLSVIGKALQEFVKEYGGIACHGDSDRFALYCPHMEEYYGLFETLQNKLDTISANTSVVLHMGVMPWEKGVDPHQMTEYALVACDLAHGRYADNLIVFNESVRERVNYEQRLKNDLHRALEDKDFEVHFQPKFDVSSETPVLKGAEALVRWRHPEFGVISPGVFIPMFEHSGQISELDKYVWSEAAAQIARWKKTYGVTVPVSVNLSRIDVFDPELENILDEILSINGIDCQSLDLEVTESAYIENADQIVSVIEKLQKKGFRIEMDDFGTGYSSLIMLSSMPINVLKIDRAFIRNIEYDEKGVQLVEVILDIADKMNAQVIAEGVETKAQLDLLKNLGCRMVQGFYFSRPLPAAEFEETFLKNGNK